MKKVDYNLSPKICKSSFCNKVITFEEREQVYCSLDCMIQTKNLQRQSRVEEYLKSPKYCKNNCGKILEYDKKLSNFCSQTCSAIYNNNQRGEDFRTIESRLLISRILTEKYSKSKTYDKTRLCKICGTVIEDRRKFCENCSIQKELENRSSNFIVTNKVIVHVCSFCKTNTPKGRKTICEECKYEYYTHYRVSCYFKFILKDFSFLFTNDDFSLLRENRMYSPSHKNNNLTGVVRDHMFSVKSGFIQKVPYQIISHPANCNLILQIDNQRKYSRNSITLQELYLRIVDCERQKSFLDKEVLEYVNLQLSIPST